MDRPVQSFYAGSVSNPSQHPTPGSGSTPKTRRGQATRERLVDAAVVSVVEHGIGHLRIEEVLTAAGSSKSQMYHYFRDRDALIDAAVAHRCAEFLGQLAPAFAVVSSLHDLAEMLERFVSDYASHLSGCPIGSLASELSTGPEPARRSVIEAFDAWEGYLTAALQRVQANDEIDADHDPADLALALLVGLEGGMFLSQVRGDDRPLRVALDTALAHLNDLGPTLD